MAFACGSDGKESAAVQETQVQSLGQEDPLEKGRLLTPVFLAGEFHGQRSLAGYSSLGCKRVGHDLATKQQQQPPSLRVSAFVLILQ